MRARQFQRRSSCRRAIGCGLIAPDHAPDCRSRAWPKTGIDSLLRQRLRRTPAVRWRVRLSPSPRGEWDGEVDYFKDNVVLRSDETAILAGTQAGTYICVADAVHGLDPPPDNETNWALFAQGHWKKLFIRARESKQSQRL